MRPDSWTMYLQIKSVVYTAEKRNNWKLLSLEKEKGKGLYFMSATRNGTISTIKWATKTRNLFCNMAPNVLKGDVARFTIHVRTWLLQIAWILTSDWINLHGSHAIHRIYVTFCKTSFPWVGKSATCTDFVAKVELLSTLCNNFSQPATNYHSLLLQDRFERGW